MNLRRREIPMGAVRAEIVVDGNELLQMASDCINIRQVGKIQGLILHDLVDRLH
jgi:hypothetical protein